MGQADVSALRKLFSEFCLNVFLFASSEADLYSNLENNHQGTKFAFCFQIFIFIFFLSDEQV